MEVFKQILSLVQSLVWPLVILYVVIQVKKPIGQFLSSYLKNDADKERDIRLKMGTFEFYANRAEIQKEQEQFTMEFLEELANETDRNKRLQMINLPRATEETLSKMDDETQLIVEKLASRQLKHAFIVNLNDPTIDGIQPEEYMNLVKLGLVKGAPMHYGDEVSWFTPLGLSVVESIEQRKQ